MFLCHTSSEILRPICHAPRTGGMLRAAFGKAVITLRYRCYTGVYRRASPKSSGEREQVSFVLWCLHPRNCLSGCKAGVDRSDGSRLRGSSVMAAQLLKNSIERCACNIVCSVFKVQRREKCPFTYRRFWGQI